MRRHALVPLALVLALAAGVAACGSEEGADVAADPDRTTTTVAVDPVPSDTDETATPTSDRVLTTAPADDGGLLCAALEGMDDPTVGIGTVEEIDDLVPHAGAFGQLAEAFERTLLPVTPPELRDDARELVTAIEDLSMALEQLELLTTHGSDQADGTRMLATRMLSGLTTDLMGQPSGTDQVRYRNYFLAWIGGECGPKELEADDPTREFVPVGDAL